MTPDEGSGEAEGARQRARDGAREGAPGSPSGGRLFVVATPIGNLGDMTYRAVEVLRAVTLVAAEDTRLTRRLFGRYEIATPLVSYHSKSGKGREAELLEHLRGGADLALVTDAGTPAVSDPGGELAGAWAAEGGEVLAIPGASAVLAALVSAALPAPRWCFEGFLPRAGRERRERISRIAADERATVIYEAGPRVKTTLADLARARGERRAAICRELTKLHEEVLRGRLDELAERASHGEIESRGEFAIVIAALTAADSSGESGSADARPRGADDAVSAARAEVRRLEADGLRHSEAVRRVAAKSGVSRRLLYDAED